MQRSPQWAPAPGSFFIPLSCIQVQASGGLVWLRISYKILTIYVYELAAMQLSWRIIKRVWIFTNIVGLAFVLLLLREGRWEETDIRAGTYRSLFYLTKPSKFPIDYQIDTPAILTQGLGEISNSCLQTTTNIGLPSPISVEKSSFPRFNIISVRKPLYGLMQERFVCCFLSRVPT